MDWRVKRLPNLKLPPKEQLSQQRCPFILEPEDRDSVPTTWMENLQFLVMSQDNAPWTGYYATFNGVKMQFQTSSEFGSKSDDVKACLKPSEWHVLPSS
jgi:hypothetical protein